MLNSSGTISYAIYRKKCALGRNDHMVTEFTIKEGENHRTWRHKYSKTNFAQMRKYF